MTMLPERLLQTIEASMLYQPLLRMERFSLLNFSYNLADDWKIDDMRIVPLCFAADGSIDNGSSALITDAIGQEFKEGQVIAGVETLGQLSNVDVYPNPVSDLLVVAGEENGTVELIDLKGKIIHTTTKTTPVFEIDVASLEKGLYLMKLSTPEGAITKTIAIQ